MLQNKNFISALLYSRLAYSGLFSFVLYLMLSPSAAFALSSDRNKPIKIQADNVTINEKTGISRYAGKVSFTQGSLILKGSEIIIHQPDGDVSKIIVTGKPATFQQQQDNKKELVTAQAGKMKYVTKDEKVYLSQNASVTQGDNLLKGNEIEYNTRTSTVTAQKSKNNTNRVHVVIDPENKTTSTPNKKTTKSTQ